MAAQLYIFYPKGYFAIKTRQRATVITTPQITGLILAGGQSQRMGQDKAQLLLPNGETQLSYTQQRLRSAGVQQVLVSGHQAPEHIVDIVVNAGPVAGIHAAVHHHPSRALLVMPVDMPLLPVSLLVPLIAYGQAQGQSCYFQEQCLPLYIHPTTTHQQQINALLSQPKSPSIWRLCHTLEAQPIALPDIDLTLDWFANANTPEQWRACLEKLR